MKPAPRHDFPVSAWPERLEVPRAVAPLFEGIWRLTLNHSVNIMFIPRFVDRAATWPPRLPDDIDAPADEIEARLVTAALAMYTVTVDDVRQGGEELIPSCDPEFEEPNLVFYVGEAEFAAYARELADIEARQPSRRQGIHPSELPDLALMRFVLGRVLVSPNVRRGTLEMLGRA